MVQAELWRTQVWRTSEGVYINIFHPRMILLLFVLHLLGGYWSVWTGIFLAVEVLPDHSENESTHVYVFPSLSLWSPQYSRRTEAACSWILWLIVLSVHYTVTHSIFLIDQIVKIIVNNITTETLSIKRSCWDRQWGWQRVDSGTVHDIQNLSHPSHGTLGWDGQWGWERVGSGIA